MLTYIQYIQQCVWVTVFDAVSSSTNPLIVKLKYINEICFYPDLISGFVCSNERMKMFLCFRTLNWRWQWRVWSRSWRTNSSSWTKLCEFSSSLPGQICFFFLSSLRQNLWSSVTPPTFPHVEPSGKPTRVLYVQLVWSSGTNAV